LNLFFFEGHSVRQVKDTGQMRKSSSFLTLE